MNAHGQVKREIYNFELDALQFILCANFATEINGLRSQLRLGIPLKLSVMH